MGNEDQGDLSQITRRAQRSNWNQTPQSGQKLEIVVGAPRISPRKPLSLHNQTTHPNLEKKKKSKVPEAESLDPLKEGREDKSGSPHANNWKTVRRTLGVTSDICTIRRPVWKILRSHPSRRALGRCPSFGSQDFPACPGGVECSRQRFGGVGGVCGPSYLLGLASPETRAKGGR